MTTAPDTAPEPIELYSAEDLYSSDDRAADDAAVMRMQVVAHGAGKALEQWAAGRGIDTDALGPHTDTEKALYWTGYLSGIWAATANQLIVHQHGIDSDEATTALAATCDDVPGWDSTGLTFTH